MSLYTLDYIGNKPGSEEIYTHAATIDNTLTIESAVLAGPVTFPHTITVTGTGIAIGIGFGVGIGIITRLEVPLIPIPRSSYNSC